MQVHEKLYRVEYVTIKDLVKVFCTSPLNLRQHELLAKISTKIQ